MVNFCCWQTFSTFSLFVTFKYTVDNEHFASMKMLTDTSDKSMKIDDGKSFRNLFMFGYMCW